MISTMTFDDLVGHYENYLVSVEPDAVDEARGRLANWLDEGDSTAISRHVRVVLVSAGFGREITTTVLWLTDLYGLDIRCVRLTPYRVGDRLLLDVQQVIPLPEANELTIQLQRKATQERAVRGTDGRDWTQYVITGPVGESEPLRKRQAILAMVTTLRAAGVPAREVATVIPTSRFLPVDGTLAGAELREAFALTYPKGDAGRWFMESPVHDEGRTWIVTKMWGAGTPSQSLNASQSSHPNNLALGTKRSRSAATAAGMYVRQCPGGT
jgi:hypothetical protein